MSAMPAMTSVVDTLLARLEAQCRADLAAIARLRQTLGAAHTSEIVCISHENPNATHYEILRHVMESRPDDAWSPCELSELTGLSQGAIRTVMYARRDEFVNESSNPKRARWRLRSAVAA